MEISGPPPGRASEAYTNNVIQRQLTEKFNEATQLDLELKEIYYLQGGEWSLAAAIDLGRVWENFGQVLLNSFIPPFLTESQQELYAMRLEDQAFPQREKAANFYAEAINQAFAANIYNDQTEFAITRLGELRSDEYPQLEEVLIDPYEDLLYTTGTELEIPYEERP